MPTVQLTKQQLADLVAKGLIPAQKKGGGKRKADAVAGSVVAAAGGVTAVLPVPTASEANVRGWRVKAARTQNARRVVSEWFGRHLALLAPVAAHYHAGRPLDVTLTRLGGQKLDAMSNLGAALKGCEDAVALMLGADDGDPRWRCRAAQEPGGPVGVRIEIRPG